MSLLHAALNCVQGFRHWSNNYLPSLYPRRQACHLPSYSHQAHPHTKERPHTQAHWHLFIVRTRAGARALGLPRAGSSALELVPWALARHVTRGRRARLFKHVRARSLGRALYFPTLSFVAHYKTPNK
jgi:hypothetical protein